MSVLLSLITRSVFASNLETINLLTIDDAEYTVPILIGSPPQGDMQAAFVLYTMGYYMSVTGNECESCTTQYYDKSSSSTANFNHATPQTRTLGPLYTETGLFGFDDVCFARSEDADLCANTVYFMEVTDVQALSSSLDGIFGLAPQDDQGTAPSYIEKLHA